MIDRVSCAPSVLDWTARETASYEGRMVPPARFALFIGFLSGCGGSATSTAVTTLVSSADEPSTVEAPPSEVASTPADSRTSGPGQCQISRIPPSGPGELIQIAFDADGRWVERRSMELPGGDGFQLGYEWAGDVVSMTLVVDGVPPRTAMVSTRRGVREWIVEERWHEGLVTRTWSLDARGLATSVVVDSPVESRWSCARDSEGRIVRVEFDLYEVRGRLELAYDAQGRVIEIREPERGHVTVVEHASGRITETTRDASGEMVLLTRYDGDCEDLVRPRCGWDPSTAFLPLDVVPR